MGPCITVGQLTSMEGSCAPDITNHTKRHKDYRKFLNTTPTEAQSYSSSWTMTSSQISTDKPTTGKESSSKQATSTTTNTTTPATALACATSTSTNNNNNHNTTNNQNNNNEGNDIDDDDNNYLNFMDNYLLGVSKSLLTANLNLFG